jgi:hypothetical protein
MHLNVLKPQDDLAFARSGKRVKFMGWRFIPWGCLGLLKFCLLWFYPSEAAATLTPAFPGDNLPAIAVEISQGFEDLAQEIEIVEISRLPNQNRENITVNSAQTYQAFTICEFLSEFDQEQGCQEKIFIEETIAGKFYQIQGIPLSWRPFTNLAWTEENILSFQRWSNPHYGLHYVVDMNQKKLVDISAFDE